LPPGRQTGPRPSLAPPVVSAAIICFTSPGRRPLLPHLRQYLPEHADYEPKCWGATGRGTGACGVPRPVASPMPPPRRVHRFGVATRHAYPPTPHDPPSPLHPVLAPRNRHSIAMTALAAPIAAVHRVSAQRREQIAAAWTRPLAAYVREPGSAPFPPALPPATHRVRVPRNIGRQRLEILLTGSCNRGLAGPDRWR